MKCNMCAIKLGRAYERYNTYPGSPDNVAFNFCSIVCRENFIDFCLSEFGKQAKKKRKEVKEE